MNRKYDFTYDNASRLTAANFGQYSGGGFDVTAGIDFTTSNLTYDANGNILSMNQKGFTVGGSNLIDQLTYTYQTNSNKLTQVNDAQNNPTSLLGDFHYTGSKGASDYTYDGNGNLITDANKSIDHLNYNYLNLPQLVHMNTKGNIVYTYDAIGNKLQKTVIDSAASKKTVTTYIGSFVHQGSSTLTGTVIDTLQFISTEEGRIRWAFHKYTTGTTAYGMEYDFFEKDHLGNTRMVLTSQKDTANYLASMESAYRTNEAQLFSNITNTSYARASVPGYPASTTITNPNDSVSKVDFNGTSGQKMGPSLLMKVMSGDNLSIAVQSYYNTNSITTSNNSFTDVLNSLANGIVNVTGGAHGTVANLTASGSSVYSGLNSFLTANDPAPPAGYPKAYLNWIFLDDQFNYVGSSSGSVKAASATYPAATLNAVAPGSAISITKNGYLYIWVSNETQGWDVFFDNLSIQHRQGPLLQEDHYYPFGLTMAGISDKAIKTNYSENKYKFNKGSELANKEFVDGTGLELYETNFRSLDPQIGRFLQVDPLAQTLPSFSPYQFADDNPIYFNDPLGLLSDSLHPQDRAPVTITAHKKTDKTSAWGLGWEWLTGSGAREHHFKDGDPFTKMLQKHEHVQDTRNIIIGQIRKSQKGKIEGQNPYELNGFTGVPKYLRDYSTLLTGGLTGNIAVTFLGSYHLKYDVVSIEEETGTAQVHFFVDNSSTAASGFRPPVLGYTDWWKNNVGTRLNNAFSSGVMSQTKQTVEWTESIQWKGDKK